MVLAVCHAVNIISDSFLQFRRVELGSGKCKTCILSGVRMMVSCDVKWDKRPDCEPQRSFKEIRYIHHKQKNKVQFSDADTRLTAKSYYPSAKMCLREILLTAWEAIAALQCNEAAGREGQCGDGPESSWMDVPGSRVTTPPASPRSHPRHPTPADKLRPPPSPCIWTTSPGPVCGPHRLQQLQPGRQSNYQEACRASLHQ